jgi:hypothetical protein
VNIREHIEQGHYPTDDKGRAMVATRGHGWMAIIAATDGPVHAPIVGWYIGTGTRGDVCAWHENGKFEDAVPNGNLDLLPPPPRKVKVLGWAVLCPNKLPRAIYATENEAKAFAYGRPVVEMTGEHEEPWS